MRRAEWIITGLSAVLLSSSGAALAQAAEPGFQLPASASPPTTSQARSDRDFLEQALGVNELELRLGRLAGQRGMTAEVKAMGEKMVEKHGELGQQLSHFAHESGSSGKPTMTADQRATLDRVMSQSEGTFDSTFTQTVDAGHIQELGMYRDEVSRAVNPQLRALVQGRVVKLQEAVAKAEATKPQSKSDW